MGGFLFILGVILVLVALGSRFFLPKKLSFMKYALGLFG